MMPCFDLREIMPRLGAQYALFLDIDGTLLDLAPSPDAVVVPASLPETLRRVAEKLDQALAVVSGRPLAQIDSLFAPFKFAGAGEYGAALRLPDGTLETADRANRVPESWRQRLAQATRAWPGTLVEMKPFGVAVHFRQEPRREIELRALVDGVVAEDPNAFEVVPGAMAFEIRSRKVNKGVPVSRLMSMQPFMGRVAVFVGDDVADHDGFRAAQRLGGIALDVHAVFGGSPANVRHWLELSAAET